MSLPIILATLRQRFTSPMRIVILITVIWMSLIPVVLSPGSGFSILGDCYFLALTIAAGMIGQDVSAGTLQLLFARPVTRTQYVFSKWAAVTLGTWCVLLVECVLAGIVIAVRGAPLPWGGAALFLANNALLALGTAAVMALFSALVPGLGDLGLLFLAFLTAQVIGGIGQFRNWRLAMRTSEELLRSLKPEIDLWSLTHGHPVPWSMVAAYVSTVAFCLAVAILLVNRKELSYASSGT